MLQQTQVATVLPYYRRFIRRFCSLDKLAHAPLHDVLCLWQGLGYYARARNLHAAAKVILRDFSGRIPSDVASLLRLPGVGRYTAGAIASLAFDKRAPILDGNVARVLCRLDCIRRSPAEATTRARLWRRAQEILPDQRVGDFNSALMELGATVCTPRVPQCGRCPVQPHCRAFAAGEQNSVPRVAASRPTPLVRRWTLCIHRRQRGAREWLIEQRPSTGRWGSLWQFITRATNGPPHADRITTVRHALTHRRYEFHVQCLAAAETDLQTILDPARATAWARLEDLPRYPLPRPHQRIAALLADR